MFSSPDSNETRQRQFPSSLPQGRSRYPSSYLVDLWMNPYTKMTDSKALHSSESNSPAPKLYSPKSPGRSARTQQWRRTALKVLVVGGDGYFDWASAHDICALPTSPSGNASRLAAAPCRWLQRPCRQGAHRCESYLAVTRFDARRSTGSV
jgi:hypothetical protein